MTTPPVPEPDDKDWTWVLDRACPDCGYHAAHVERAAVPTLVRRHAGTLAAALAGPGAAVRPAPEVWSPLEYGCHVRDVCRIFIDRLRLMLDEDDPQFANWDQDATALEDRYWTQDPAVVAPELSAAAN